MEENKPKEEKTAVVNKDEVSIKQASVASVNNTKTENSSNTFSFAGYAVKFTIFLALVLGLFYGIVQLLKKGVFSRGKLGFLNNAQMIEVLSTSFIAPKKSLMVIRVHKQIFLVANSEAGITLLSEMKDTSGLIKEGEKQITGTNFDENITTAEFNNSDNFRIKENILESSPLPPETRIEKLVAAKDDIVKFSDELKKKAKKLRPIENRAN
jgi:flagellar biogenesis protein FliO